MTRERIKQDRRWGKFGNRSHGRFPRIGVQVEDGTRRPPRNFLIVITNNRHEYEHGPSTYLCLKRGELIRLRRAIGEALRYP